MASAFIVYCLMVRNWKIFQLKYTTRMFPWDSDKSFCRTHRPMSSFPQHQRAYKSAWLEIVKCPGFLKNNIYIFPRCKRDTLNSAVTAHWWEHSVRVCLTVGKDLWDSLSWRWNLPQRGRFGSKKEKLFAPPRHVFYFLPRISSTTESNISQLNSLQ